MSTSPLHNHTLIFDFNIRQLHICSHGSYAARLIPLPLDKDFAESRQGQLLERRRFFGISMGKRLFFSTSGAHLFLRTSTRSCRRVSVAFRIRRRLVGSGLKFVRFRLLDWLILSGSVGSAGSLRWLQIVRSFVLPSCLQKALNRRRHDRRSPRCGPTTSPRRWRRNRSKSGVNTVPSRGWRNRTHWDRRNHFRSTRRRAPGWRWRRSNFHRNAAGIALLAARACCFLFRKGLWKRIVKLILFE